MPLEAEIIAHLRYLYGEQEGLRAWGLLQDRLKEFQARHRQAAHAKADLSQVDALLITYGDQVHRSGEPPLRTLVQFAREYLRGVVNGIHLLPFFPYSSDDGFSVINYWHVNPHLGTWDDVRQLGSDFRLMFDGVINHISAQSDWFQSYLRMEQPYKDFFINVDPSVDLSMVVRPRALPLLTQVQTAAGTRYVWTTFSADQIDLNYANPEVMLAMVNVLLFYVSHGADFIRLDAIAYLWKEIGSTCIHLPQTHRFIQLLRAILDMVAPGVMLITETNVPHADNVSYFGNGYNQAQLVYNFALPPLVLHTLHTGNGSALSRWAAGLETPSERTTFFNFLASHDGIGLNPARGILTPQEIQAMVSRTTAHGGLVSYKTEPDGRQSPYELNVNYFDALSDPQGSESLEIQIARFICAHAIMFAIRGVPGIYFHSLFGSRGWPQGVKQTGRNRTINRQKLDYNDLCKALQSPETLRARVYRWMALLLAVRSKEDAFHPQGSQKVLDYGPSVFALLRKSPSGNSGVICLHNLLVETCSLELDLGAFGASSAQDLFGGDQLGEGPAIVELQPYQVMWLKLNSS